MPFVDVKMLVALGHQVNDDRYGKKNGAKLITSDAGGG